MRVVAALGFFSVLLATGSAWAEDVYLDYAATEGCPSREQFENQVVARTALVRFVREPHAGRFFKVYVGAEATLAVGRLTSGRGQEAGSAREVSSQSCDDVAAALALIVALAVDPHASLAPLLPPSATFPSDGASPQASATPSPNQPPNIRQDSSSLGTWASPPAVGQHDAALAQPHASPIAVELGVHSGGSLWFASATVPWAEVGVSLGAEQLQPALDSGVIQLSLAYAKSARVHTEGEAGARFDAWWLNFEYCPLRFAIATGVILRPCASIEGGRLTATGFAAGNIVDAWSRSRNWGAVSELARVQIRLGHGWQTILEAGLTEPFWHDKFVFYTPKAAPIATVPLLAPRLTLGVAVRFW